MDFPATLQALWYHLVINERLMPDLVSFVLAPNLVAVVENVWILCDAFVNDKNKSKNYLKCLWLAYILPQNFLPREISTVLTSEKCYKVKRRNKKKRIWNTFWRCLKTHLIIVKLLLRKCDNFISHFTWFPYLVLFLARLLLCLFSSFLFQCIFYALKNVCMNIFTVRK